MKHARSTGKLLSVMLLAWASQVFAVILEPLPGSAPQTTHTGAFFANDVALIVRNEAGAPLAGVPVTFELPFDSRVGSLAVTGRLSPFTLASNADGIVVVPWLLAFSPGTTVMVARTDDGAAASFELGVVGGDVWDLQGVQGNGQAAPVGTEYRLRWAVSVLDGDRQPIPYGCVEFAEVEPWNPGGLFGDIDGYFKIDSGAEFPDWARVYARADEHGVAIAPAWIANDNGGHHLAIATACTSSHIDRRGYAPRALFQYTNTPPPSAH